mgnify:CR=1 FL=1
MKTVGIICAMKEELESIEKILKIEKTDKYFELDFAKGKIGKNNCILVESGMGKVNAARSTQILIDSYHPDYILNIVVAGGIDASLKIGDIVVATELVQHDYDATGMGFEKCLIPNAGKFFKTNEYLINLAADEAKKSTDANVRKGVVASGDLFCTDPEIGKRINQELGALCVEMEGASVAQVCHLCNIPFLVLRGISDVPNNDNFVDFADFLKEDLHIMTKTVKNVLEKI